MVFLTISFVHQNEFWLYKYLNKISDLFMTFDQQVGSTLLNLMRGWSRTERTKKSQMAIRNFSKVLDRHKFRNVCWLRSAYDTFVTILDLTSTVRAAVSGTSDVFEMPLFGLHGRFPPKFEWSMALFRHLFHCQRKFSLGDESALATFWDVRLKSFTSSKNDPSDMKQSATCSVRYLLLSE